MKKILGALTAFCVLTVGLTACNSAQEYSVTCKTADNGYVTVADDSVKAGEKVILAAHPEKGYALKCFVVDGEELDGCSFVMPDKDVTVSASFAPLTYTVTYVFGDNTVTQTYTAESAGELTPPQKEGYEICGWYGYGADTEEYWNIEEFRVTSLEGLFGNLTLYAKYYNPPHEIHVEEKGNGWCFAEEYYSEAFYGEIYNLYVEPDTGYELVSLTVNGEPIEGTQFTMPAGDAEITAEFAPIVYSISYFLDGGENNEENPDTFTVEDGRIYLHEPTKEGYNFICWYYDEEMRDKVWEDELNVYDCIESPLTLYAYFEPDEEDYEDY